MAYKTRCIILAMRYQTRPAGDAIEAREVRKRLLGLFPLATIQKFPQVHEAMTKAQGITAVAEGAPEAVAVAESSRSLLLWGGIGTDSIPFLDPAFVVDAPAALPDTAGEYRLTGRTESGAELFSLSFDMPEVADGDGSSGFVFVLPVQPGWADNLANITLSGPSDSATLDGDSDIPMAILRNPRNGQVRGILRDLPLATQAAPNAAGRAAGPSLQVLFSRGIPDAASWSR